MQGFDGGMGLIGDLTVAHAEVHALGDVCQG